MAAGHRGFILIRWRGASSILLALTVLVFLFSCAPSADAFCPPGEGAGECASPAGLAVDYETGHLYVADRANNRVDVFKENGEFLFAFGWGVADGTTNALQSCGPAATPPTASCFKGIAGVGLGQFQNPTKVAVDNDPASPSYQDVYVFDASITINNTIVPSNRVEKFSPSGEFIWTVGKEGNGEGEFAETVSVGSGPGGVLYVLDNIRLPEDKEPGHGQFRRRVQRFKPSGEPIPPQCILGEGPAFAGDLAVDSGGDFWVAEGTGLWKYDASCAPLLENLDENRVSAVLARDEEDNLFAAQQEGSFRMITAHKPSGEIISRFHYVPFDSPPPKGLAAHNGNIFISLGKEGIKRFNLPPPGPIAVQPLKATKVGSAKATLVAEINPEGKATTAHFEYVEEATYQRDIAELGADHGFDHAIPTTSKPLGAEGFELKAFEDLAGCPNPASEAGKPGSSCLTPETKYRWRVIATNPDPGEGTVEGPPFETKRSPEIGDTYATGVGTDTARLHAEVNPLSIPATGFFEYVDDARFQESGFEEAIKIPDVEGGEAPLDYGAGETPVTRSVSVYPLEPGAIYHYRIVADNPVVEPRVGEERLLRTFSPSGIEPCPQNEASRIGAGALLPDCRAYELVSPLDKAGGDIQVLINTLGDRAVLEQSSGSGERLAYGSERAFGDALSAPWTSQYIAQRVEGEEWETHAINPPRGRPLLGPTTQADTEFRAFSPDLCEAWLTTFAEPPPGMPGLTEFMNLERRSDRLCGPEGFEALAPIEPPTGVPKGASFLLGLQGVSGDGTHAIFSANGKLASGGSAGQRQLYESVRGVGLRFVCFLPNGSEWKSPCAAGSSAGGLTDNRASVTGAISDDGERIFWTDHGPPGEGKIYARIGGTQTVAISKEAEEAAGTSASWFWGAAADGSEAILSTGENLYRVSLEGEETKTSPIAEGVLGVMGMSEDAGRVYFASNKAIVGSGQNSEGEEAQADQANLYLQEAGEGGGSTRYIATLANVDLKNIVAKNPHEETARVAPDGAHAAFVSIAPLTPYENEGAESGEATQEVYRYDANANKLICASCNPSGARPAGPATLPFFESSMHGARVLSDNGSRLYFESADTLAARDSNGRVDVYQWEEAGAGGCEAADADFSPAAGGCIEPISSGQSPQDSLFIESSPSGDDVFFATGSSLLPEDYGLIDIYDARVDGGLPIPPPSAPPCEGDACHPQIQAPEEPTPSSSDYHGPPEGASGGQNGKGRCPKGKKAVKKKGKSRCVPTHKKQKRHHRRAAR